MNSTKKYIQDEEMIDLVRFKNTDIKSLEIWIGDGQREKRTLRKKYKINTNGRIEIIERYDEEWTAYPPIKLTHLASQEKENFSIEETLFWDENDNLVKALILNKKSNQVTERKYFYERNNLLQIDDPVFQKRFIYNDDNNLLEAITTLKITTLEGTNFHKLFFYNQNGQLIEKVSKLMFTSGRDSVEYNEVFKYNESNQILESIQRGEDEEQVFKVFTTFEYLNSSSNKFVSVSINENGKFKSEMVYKYSGKGILKNLFSRNSEGLMTETVYIRE